MKNINKVGKKTIGKKLISKGFLDLYYGPVEDVDPNHEEIELAIPWTDKKGLKRIQKFIKKNEILTFQYKISDGGYQYTVIRFTNFYKQ